MASKYLRYKIYLAEVYAKWNTKFLGGRGCQKLVLELLLQIRLISLGNLSYLWTELNVIAHKTVHINLSTIIYALLFSTR